MQAKYTDIILLSKWELLSERELDLMLDHVYELNPDTPKIKFTKRLTHEVVFGLDTHLFEAKSSLNVEELHTDHHDKEIDTIQMLKEDAMYKKVEFEFMLSKMNNLEDVYRIKGVVKIDVDWFILNWAFGRYTLTACKQQPENLRVTIMGIDLRLKLDYFCKQFNISKEDVILNNAK